MAARVIEHGAPTGDGSKHTETEEAQSGLRENRSGHADGGLNQNGLKNIGQEMLPNDSEVRSAERACGYCEFKFFDFEDLRTRQTRIAGPTGDDERKDYFANARTEERGERDSQKNSRKGQKRIDEKKIHDTVAPSAEVTSECADGEADQSAAGNYADGNRERDASAKHDSGKDVAAEFIGAHPVNVRRGCEASGKILREGIRGSDQGSQHSDQDQK